jgi:DNA invertase Pin-like site-specific DNA recombinase
VSRYFRRAIPDFSDVVGWARKNDVLLVSATENLGDPRLHRELLLPLITAWTDQGDSETKSEILTELYAKIRKEGRWHGGKPPYGYMSAQAGPK